MEEFISGEQQPKAKSKVGSMEMKRESSSRINGEERRMEDINEREELPKVEWIDKHVISESCVFTQRNDERYSPSQSIPNFVLLPH